MSDSECEGDVQLLGGALPFDADTGRVLVGDDTVDPSTASYSNADMTDAPTSTPTPSGRSTPQWEWTLAEKNAHNTFDLSQPHMVGIDEAGRGPVLGAMVYGICWCPVSKLDELKAIKVADSKTLTLAQRESLFRTIRSTPWLGYEVDVITADRLSREMLRRNRANLNAISHDSAIALIQKVIDHGVNVREVYVDTVGDAGKYQSKLQGIFPGIAITVAKKADSLYPVVSAASIAAKVTRDVNLLTWKFEEERPVQQATDKTATNADDSSFSWDTHSSSSLTSSSTLPFSRFLGTGYPGDPLTKAWMSSHLDGVFGYPSLVRFSWGTTKKLIKSSTVQVEWGDEEEEEGEEGEDGEEKGAQKMEQFFTASKEGGASSSASPSASASSSTPALVTTHPNQKKFSSLHDSLTRKQHAIPCHTRVGWFQKHRLDLATTF